MYICLCNGLTDRQVREVALSGTVRASEVYRACGCTVKCGSCARTIREIIKEAAFPDCGYLQIAAE